MRSEAVPLLRLALPQGSALKMVCDHLRACGFGLPDLTKPWLYRALDPFQIGVSFDVFRIAPSDVGTYVEHGIAELGVMSTELIRESESSTWRPYTFPFAAYPIVLAARRGVTLEALNTRPTLRLATSLPRLTREAFAGRVDSIEIVRVHDPTTACLLGLADGYVALMEDPEVLLEQDFRVLEIVGWSRLKLLVNRASYAGRRGAIERFVDELERCAPEAPPPLEIPFDRND